MKKQASIVLACALAAEAALGGLENVEQNFMKDEVKDFRLLGQHEVDDALATVVAGKMVFVASRDNGLIAIDSDLKKVVWEKHFGEPPKAKHGCDESLAATPAVSGDARRIYLLTGDGILRTLNEEDGSQAVAAKQFVRAGVKAATLHLAGDVIYTATHSGCGREGAIWALDTKDTEAKVRSVKLGADVAGLSVNGRIFAQTEDGPLEPANRKYGGALLELDKNLAVKQYFIMPEGPGKKASPGMNVTAPISFKFHGVELVATVGKDGRVYLLKAADLGTEDHHHFIAKSLVVPAMDGEKAHGIGGGIASSEDADGSRYLLVPVWGPLSDDLKAAVEETSAPHGSIVVFKVENDQEGVAGLKPVWVSRDMDSPAAPVIADGVVFELANGPKKKKAHATLFAFDGSTGKELYSTGDQITAAGNLGGVTIANGRVYFVTADDVVRVFGKPFSTTAPERH